MKTVPPLYTPALRAVLERTLICPKCRAMNTPTVSVIHIDERGETACDTCARSGPVQDFQSEGVFHR